MQTILITGGSGLIGKALSKHLLDKGYKVIILTRSAITPKSAPVNLSYAHWDINKQSIDIAAVQSSDYIIHLAGAGIVDKRWTHKYKEEIQNSRIKSSQLIIDTLKKNPHSVKAIISAAATGYYGPDSAVNTTGAIETDKPYSDFLANTCTLWEQSIEPDFQSNIRIVKLRTGIVLSNDGGAFTKFKRPLNFGIAAILGSGKQMISWIHIEDLCRLYTYAIENELLNGPYNAATHAPVTNKELTLKLAEQLRGKAFIPIHVPAFMLKIILGESSIVVLKSTTVNSNKIKQAGFTFIYPSIEAALAELCK